MRLSNSRYDYYEHYHIFGKAQQGCLNSGVKESSLFAGCGALFQFRQPAKVFVRYAFDLVKFFEVGDRRRTIKKVPLKRYKSLLAICQVLFEGAKNGVMPKF